MSERTSTLIIGNDVGDGNYYSTMITPPETIAGKKCLVQLKSFSMDIGTTTGKSLDIRLSSGQPNSYDARRGTFSTTVGIYANHLYQTEQPKILMTMPSGPTYIQVEIFDLQTNMHVLDSNDDPPETSVLFLQVEPID